MSCLHKHGLRITNYSYETSMNIISDKRNCLQNIINLVLFLNIKAN